MKTGKSIIGKIFSKIFIWVIIGLVGAVLIQKGWNYYTANKEKIADKLPIDPKAITDVTKKSVAKVKEFTGPKTEKQPRLVIKDETGQQQHNAKESDVFKRLGNLADPEGKVGLVSDFTRPAEKAPQATAVTEARKKKVVDRQINLISELLSD